MSPAHLSEVERGIKEPSLGALARIADAIGVGPGEVFLDLAIALEPRPYFFNGHGELLRAVRRFDEAAASFRVALGAKPGDAQVRNNLGLFMHRDEVESAWKWIDGIIDSWQQAESEIQDYVAGTWGPTNAVRLMDRDGREWCKPHV